MTQLTVITGASSGIGLETAKGLAALGQEVVMVCRDAARGGATARRRFCLVRAGVQPAFDGDRVLL